MKLVLSKFLLSLTLLLSVSTSHAIMIYPEKIDFGRVKKFTGKKRYVLIKNEHSENVEIIGIVNACGLALKLEKKIILPGEVVEGELLFDSGMPQGAFEEKLTILFKKGNFIIEKRISVSWYNYPEKYPEIILKKKSIDLGLISPKKAVPFSFEILNTGNMVLTVTGSLGEGFLTNLPVNINPGEKRRVLGSLTVENVGEGEKTLYLETNDLNNPKILIPVKYMASWDAKKGIFIQVLDTVKIDDGYEVAIKIDSHGETVQLIHFEDVEGKRLPTKSETRRLIPGNESGIFLLKLTDKEYEKLKNSSLSIHLSISF